MRSIDEIGAELLNHPDFVCGNFLTKQHLEDAGYNPNDFQDMSDLNVYLTQQMWDEIDEQTQTKGM